MGSTGSVEPARLTGEERFEGGATVLDFWRWALGDLRMNTARGFLAEYLVTLAVGSDAPIRIEWATHDVETAEGARLEVKASGYLQSWSQGRLSVPSYSFKAVHAAEVWDGESAQMKPVEPADRVDAWVFALQTCVEPDGYDPLSLDQWEFRVIPHRRLLASGQTSARLSFFDRLGVEAVGYGELGAAAKAAALENSQLGPPK
jgi:hypothetical protein